MSELPPTWAEVPFSAITVDAPQRVPLADEVIRYIDIGSVNRNTKSVESPQELLGKDAPSRARKQVAVGDTLVSMTRPNLNAVALVPKELDGQIASTGFDVLRPVAGVDSRWIGYLVRTEAFVEAMSDLVQGALYPAVRSKDVRAHVVPLAPQAEQTRIANQLDTLLTRVQTCNDRFDAIPALLKRFRQTVLSAASSGKLTDDWRVLHQDLASHATTQLDAITDVRLNLTKRTKEPVTRIKTEEFDIPAGWVWTSLDTMAAKIVDGTHHTPTYVDVGVPFISVKDIRDGVINFSQTKFISESEHAELSKRCFVQKGDLLITKSGTIGRTAIVRTETPFSLFVSVALVKPTSPLVNMQFVDFVLQNWVASIDVSSRIVGSTIKNLHLVDMKVLGIPFPSLEEQAEIVRRVEVLFALADRIEASCTAARAQAQRLTPLVLAKAFRGELVPQDPNDEPASALLARIGLAKAAVAGKNKPKVPVVPKERAQAAINL